MGDWLERKQSLNNQAGTNLRHTRDRELSRQNRLRRPASSRAGDLVLVRGSRLPSWPEPPAPAASAAHTQTGHCARQGSSGAQRHASTPRLGSLRASPRGSHWRQASSTGPAAPAPRATTH